MFNMRQVIWYTSTYKSKTQTQKFFSENLQKCCSVNNPCGSFLNFSTLFKEIPRVILGCSYFMKGDCMVSFVEVDSKGS